MITVRTDMWPTLVAFAWGDISIDDVEKLKAIMGEVHGRKERFAQIYDTRGVNVPAASVRRALGGLARFYDAETRTNIIGNAVVVSGRVIAGALTAVQWMSDNTLPLRYFPSGAQSLAWLQEQAGKEDVTLTGAIEDFVSRLDKQHSDGTGLDDVRVDLLRF